MEILKTLMNWNVKSSYFLIWELHLWEVFCLEEYFCLGWQHPNHILNDEPNIKGHSWNEVGAIIGVVCNLFTFAGLGILDARRLC